MELTKKQVDITKGIAILFMLLLHLFCTKNYQGLYQPLVFIGEVPLIYYIALFGDCCVAIYCFCSGYGLMKAYKSNKYNYTKRNLKRIFKLYVNYWIIIFMFVIIIGGIINKSDVYPGNIKTLLLSLLGIVPYYNGAWWFITTYMILVLISPFINNIVEKYNCKLITIISLIIYIATYIQRIKEIIVFDNVVLQWGIINLALLGTSQLPFIMGSIFANEEIYTKIYNFMKEIKVKNLVAITMIILLVVIHSFIETLFIAVFTGIVFIILFNLIDKPKWLNNLLLYLSKHSTNMWLTHMFFYMIFFKELVFSLKYPIFIFIWLVILCLISSHIINKIYYSIISKIEYKRCGKIINYN